MKHMLRSRYFVMIRKCCDISCCQPMRSPLRKILPTGFLPSPRVFGHNTNGDLVLWKADKVDKTVRFASLSNILSQPASQSLPFDSYNLKVQLPETVCPFCNVSLCSPAEYKRHRRAMHFRKRAPPGFLLNLGEVDRDDEDQIKEVINDREGEYLCVMEDREDVEWRKLPPSHPLIMKYKKKREELLQNQHDGPLEIPESDLAEFMGSIWEDI